MNHIMIDLETLDSRETAAIISIGAVKFNPERGNLGGEFYKVVSIESSVSYGLTTSWDTVRWWMTQSDAARNLFTQKGEDLDLTLLRFQGFCAIDLTLEDAQKETVIWGNGSTFDNMILRNAYKSCGMKYPAHYWNDLCFRTMKTMFGVREPKSSFSGVKHNALDDAKNQAKALIEILKKVKK